MWTICAMPTHAARSGCPGSSPWKSLIDSFPRNFGLFAGCIDPGVPEESQGLALLVDSLGRDRILNARSELIAEEGVVDPPVAERLTELDTPSVLPFLRLILEAGSEPMRRKVVEALRRIRGREPSACLLRLGSGECELPRPYLLALTDDKPGSDRPWTFRSLVVSQICHLVRVLADRKERIAGRLEAIELLGLFHEVEARAQLQSLVRARRFGVFPRESRTVREAARRALRANAKVRLEA